MQIHFGIASNQALPLSVLVEFFTLDLSKMLNSSTFLTKGQFEEKKETSIDEIFANVKAISSN